MFLIRIAIDHGRGDIKTVHFRFRAGVLEILTEPAFFDNVIEYNGKYYKVGTKRSAVMDNKTSNDDYYILTLAAIAKELKHMGRKEAKILIAAGLPATRYGAEKKAFAEYLGRNKEVVFMLPLWYMCGVEGTAQIDYWDLKGKDCQLIDSDIAFADEIKPSVVGPSITMAPRSADTMRECPLPVPDYDKDLFYKNFVAALKGEEELFVKPSEVLRVSRIIDLAFESGRRNEVIQCSI